jgi:DNA polymerase-1
MHVAFIDLETDGLVNECSRIVCLGSKHNDGPVSIWSDPETIGMELAKVAEADIVVAHNMLGFDLQVIRKLYPGMDFGRKCLPMDTMVMARLVEPDVRETDYARPGFPKDLHGSHSLRAWAHRIGMAKGNALDEVTDFRNLQFTPELGEYCIKDVQITAALYRKFRSEIGSAACLPLEHLFAECIVEQEVNGIGFDEAAAATLYSRLAKERLDLVEDLVRLVPATRIQMKTKVKEVPFNPASRQQIAAYLKSLGWDPEEFTPSGDPVVNETVLGTLEYPIAKRISHYLLVQKRLGMLSEGEESWMKLAKGGRIYGRVNHNGAVTGRCTHRNPNMAQVPSVGSPYGKECRSLFVAPPGKLLVGVDASGLELRCLAHYMAKWDGGEYARELLEGDIHTANQKAAGLPTRNDAKTFIYAFLYGAGPAKLGSIVGGGAAEGRALQKRFLEKVPALGSLKTAIEDAVSKRGYLIGIDGRRLRVRSKHAALNTLLQSAGAVAMKQATVTMRSSLPKDCLQVAHVHDEVQWEVPEDRAHEVIGVVKECIASAGRELGFRIRLDGEARSGRNWAETH